MSDFDTPCETEGSKAPSSSHVTMRYVAVAAGVSIATVSNVINHPHLVAARTRERVERFVEELDFKPDPHAKALRTGTPNTDRRRSIVPDLVIDGRDDTSDAPKHVPAHAGSAPSSSDLTLETLKPGQHLSLQMGPEFLSGIVDVVMPDQSCFWIWADGGMGRRMINSSDAAIV